MRGVEAAAFFWEGGAFVETQSAESSHQRCADSGGKKDLPNAPMPRGQAGISSMGHIGVLMRGLQTSA